MVATVSARTGFAGRDHLLSTLEAMQRELESGAEWENNTLERYIDGFSALLRSIDQAYENEGRPMPEDPWILLAEVFQGARDYE